MSTYLWAMGGGFAILAGGGGGGRELRKGP